MTNQGAIKILKCIQKKYSENMIGFQAVENGIEALEKQILKKAHPNFRIWGVRHYTCPTCGNNCLVHYAKNGRNELNFCWDCGQRLDWSKEDE